MVLDKTLESPLDCKEIQPGHGRHLSPGTQGCLSSAPTRTHQQPVASIVARLHTAVPASGGSDPGGPLGIRSVQSDDWPQALFLLHCPLTSTITVQDKRGQPRQGGAARGRDQGQKGGKKGRDQETGRQHLGQAMAKRQVEVTVPLDLCGFSRPREAPAPHPTLRGWEQMWVRLWPPALADCGLFWQTLHISPKQFVVDLLAITGFKDGPAEF